MAELAVEVAYPTSNSKDLVSVMKAVQFKGDTATVQNLKITLTMEENRIKSAIESGVILGYVQGDSPYSLTQLGDDFLSQSQKEQQDLMAVQFLGLGYYKDLVYRMSMAENQFLQRKDLEQAFYILDANMREETRKAVVDSFQSFGSFADILSVRTDAANPGVELTKNGSAKLQESIKGKGKAPAKTTASGVAKASGDVIIITGKCYACEKGVGEGFVACPWCGVNLRNDCPGCGKEINPQFVMCPWCGQKLK